MPVPAQTKDVPFNTGTLFLHCYTGLKSIHVIDFCLCSFPQAKLANGTTTTVYKGKQNISYLTKPVPVCRGSRKVGASVCTSQK